LSVVLRRRSSSSEKKSPPHRLSLRKGLQKPTWPDVHWDQAPRIVGRSRGLRGWQGLAGTRHPRFFLQRYTRALSKGTAPGGSEIPPPRLPRSIPRAKSMKDRVGTPAGREKGTATRDVASRLPRYPLPGGRGRSGYTTVGSGGSTSKE
jgi:hypothetical protein